jgi:hypothetical protein
MITQHPHIIHERSHNIPINKNLSNTNSTKGEYSLKQNFFDPSKSSPPNEFMLKLRMRVEKHYMDNNDVSCDIE